eukprot:2460760-Alexandrium_andersonii.AAC.1
MNEALDYVTASKPEPMVMNADESEPKPVELEDNGDSGMHMSADREALLRKYEAFMLQLKAEAEDELKRYCNKIRGGLADRTLLDWCEVPNKELIETA